LAASSIIPEVNHRLVRVQDLENLLLIGAGVRLHLFRRQPRARGVLARGVPDHPGEVPDQEDRRMPQLLELAHLVDEDRVAEVQVRGSGVEPGLNAQRRAPRQLFFEVGLGQEL
jgi:hypothetical protein